MTIKTFRAVIFCLLAAATAQAMGADILREVSDGVRQSEDGGYFELGFMAGYAHSPLQWTQLDDLDDLLVSLDLSLDYRKHGFFIEGIQGAQDGLNLGYSAWQNQDWSVDIIAASLFGLCEPKFYKPVDQVSDDEVENLNCPMDNLYAGAGVRVSRYLGEYVAQYRLVNDIYSQNGWVSTLRVGRGWQYRNWNFHTIVSGQYTSQTTNRYWYGVSEDRATAFFLPYSPGASYSYGVQFGAVKPLSEKWLLKLFAGWNYLPADVRDSPFADNSHHSYFTLAVNRVFSSGQ